MSVTEYTAKPPAHDDDTVIEITLSDVVRFFKESRSSILIAALIGGIIGALYAFNKPNLYTAQVTVMPEIQGKGASGLGGLGSLAGLAGISIDNMGGQDAIRPELYPNIVQSMPFALDLLKRPVYSQKLNTSLTLQAFIERIAGESWLGKVYGSDEKTNDIPLDPQNFSQAVQVTKKQEELIKSVQASVATIYDKKTGIITIAATEPDPVVAATVARLSLDYLTNYITSYRTEKSRKQVEFLAQRVAEAQNRYKSTEYTLSAYRDRNQSLYTNTAKIDEQRLQADYLLAQSVYTDLSKQLEQAKIKVQEETPVFKTLEPPTVPLQKSGPKRMVLVLGFAIAGLFLSLAISVVQRLLNRR